MSLIPGLGRALPVEVDRTTVITGIHPCRKLGSRLCVLRSPLNPVFNDEGYGINRKMSVSVDE